MLAGAVAVAVNHARMLIAVGVATTLVAAAVVALVKLGREPLSDVVDTQVGVDAFNPGYDAVTSSLVTQSAILAIVGILVAIGGVLWTTRTRGNERPAFWA